MSNEDDKYYNARIWASSSSSSSCTGDSDDIRNERNREYDEARRRIGRQRRALLLGAILVAHQIFTGGDVQRGGSVVGRRYTYRDSSQQMAAQDPRIAGIASLIRVIPDFPKPGIIFQDITTLLLNTKAFKDTIDLFVERYADKGISVVAGKVVSQEYSLEYGTDKIEMHVGAVQEGERALVIDDLIATSRTLGAAIKLLERCGANVVECACVIELPELQGRANLGDKPLFILVSPS